jgi:hypothetical protein
MQKKQLHLDSLILKHPICYVILSLDMTKLNHLAKTIGYSTFSSMGYTTRSQLPTAIDQPYQAIPKHTNPARTPDRS